MPLRYCAAQVLGRFRPLTLDCSVLKYVCVGLVPLTCMLTGEQRSSACTEQGCGTAGSRSAVQWLGLLTARVVTSLFLFDGLCRAALAAELQTVKDALAKVQLVSRGGVLPFPYLLL